jgi:hypothetical protein
MSTPEGKIKDPFKADLKELTNLYQFWPVQMGLGATTLDALLSVSGLFVAVEAKKAHKKYGENTTLVTDSGGYSGWVTARQAIVATAIINSGARFYLIDTKERAKEVVDECRRLQSEQSARNPRG